MVREGGGPEEAVIERIRGACRSPRRERTGSGRAGRHSRHRASSHALLGRPRRSPAGPEVPDRAGVMMTFLVTPVLPTGGAADCLWKKGQRPSKRSKPMKTAPYSPAPRKSLFFSGGGTRPDFRGSAAELGPPTPGAMHEKRGRASLPEEPPRPLRSTRAPSGRGLAPATANFPVASHDVHSRLPPCGPQSQTSRDVAPIAGARRSPFPQLL